MKLITTIQKRMSPTPTSANTANTANLLTRLETLLQTELEQNMAIQTFRNNGLRWVYCCEIHYETNMIRHYYCLTTIDVHHYRNILYDNDDDSVDFIFNITYDLVKCDSDVYKSAFHNTHWRRLCDLHNIPRQVSRNIERDMVLEEDCYSSDDI